MSVRSFERLAGDADDPAFSSGRRPPAQDWHLDVVALAELDAQLQPVGQRDQLIERQCDHRREHRVGRRRFDFEYRAQPVSRFKG